MVGRAGRIADARAGTSRAARDPVAVERPSIHQASCVRSCVCVPRVASLASVAGCAFAFVACTGSEQPRDSVPSSQSSSLTSPSRPSPDETAAGAVTAYQAFWRTAINAQRRPVAAGSDYPRDADVARFSFDPVRSAYRGFIAGLAAQGVQFRGTPPAPRVSVISVEPAAAPYPLVRLRDCQTPAPDWNEYLVATGKQVPRATPKVPPPYEITAKVIFHEGRWGVQSTTTHSSRTCTA